MEQFGPFGSSSIDTFAIYSAVPGKVEVYSFGSWELEVKEWMIGIHML